MSATPLRLKNYFLTDLSLKANPDFKPEEFQDGTIDVNAKASVRVGTHKEKPNEFQVVLGIIIEPRDERKLPYDVSMEIVGFFEVDSKFTTMPHADFVQVNGSSILYSAAREILLSVMGRGPWEPLMLPTISFVKPKKAELETTVEKK